MSTIVTVNDRDVKRALSRLSKPSTQLRMLRPGMRASGKIFRTSMKQKAPKETGLLRRSIKTKAWTRKVNKKGVAVGNNTRPDRKVVGVGRDGRKRVPANYAHLVELGTKAHTVQPKTAGALAFLNITGKGKQATVQGIVITKKASIPAIPARPFMRPAFEQNKDRAARLVIERTWKEIEKEWRKK